MFTKKQIFALFWPSFLEQALMVSVGFISTLLIAGVSSHAVSGIGLVESVNMVIIGLFGAVAAGAAVIVSQRIGAGDMRAAGRAAGDSLSLALIASAGAGALVIIFAGQIVRLFFGGAEQAVVDNAVIYLRFAGFSYPFLALQQTYGAIFRAARNAKIPMFSSLLANLVLVAASLVLIQALGLGIYGSGAALVLARFTGALALFIMVKKRKIDLKIPRFTIKLGGSVLKQVLRIAIPSGIDQMLFSGGKLIIATFLTTFGTAAIAASAMSNNVFSIVNLPGMTIFAISTTVIGQLFGAGENLTVKRYMLYFFIMSTLAALAASAIFLPLLPMFVSLYNQSQETNEIAMEAMRFALVMMPLFWPAAFPIPQMLRAIGDVKYTMAVSVSSMFLARIVGSWFFGIHLGLGLLGIWYAMILDWIIRGLFFVPRAILSLKRRSAEEL